MWDKVIHKISSVMRFGSGCGKYGKLRCVVLFSGAMALFLVPWAVVLFFEARQDVAEKRVAAVEAIRRAEGLLGDTLRTFAADILILAGEESLPALADGSPEAVDIVAEHFLRIAKHKKVVAQLRFLNADGFEVVRVDRIGTQLERRPNNALQDKHNRDYFRRTIGLTPGGLYISALDLNVENGEIEVPWHPMLRLATPIVGVQGQERGVLVINLSARGLLDAFLDIAQSANTSMQWLNGDGYWLSGVPQEKLWGFMRGLDSRIENQSPRLWQSVLASHASSSEDGDFFYHFRSIEPGAWLDIPKDKVLSDAGRWILLSSAPKVTAASLWRRANPWTLLSGVFLVAVLFLAWVGSVVTRQRIEESQRETEKVLLRFDRLANLGGLVAGVAHELNTPIGNAVTLASSLEVQSRQMRDELQRGAIKRSSLNGFLEKMHEGTGIMLRGLGRADSLLRTFKQVAVDQTSERRRQFDLHELVEDVRAALMPKLKNTPIKLFAQIPEGIAFDSFPGSLEQVLMNLVNNAVVHGFDDGQPGQVTVVASQPNADFAEIEISDCGRGIAAEVRDRIFEPFFTTRLGQGGSGLGLSIVLRIVTGILGGTIHVMPTPGGGTTFILQLPLRAPTPSASATQEIHYAA